MTRVIGITGGIASGKSFVSMMLAQKGAEVISADLIAGQVLEIPMVTEAVKTQWGEAVFEKSPLSQKISRKKLASAVFGSHDPEQIHILNQITHPFILSRIKERLADFSSRKIDTIVIDAPLLYETGLDTLCGTVIFVDTFESIRLERALQRGWSEDELKRRESFQIPIEIKRNRADFILNNNGSSEELKKELDKILSNR